MHDVAETIVAIERSCLAADHALDDGDLVAVQQAIAEQDALQVTLEAHFAEYPGSSPARDRAVAARVAGILEFRARQLERLGAYRDALRERLDGIGKVRRLNRGVGRHVEAPRHFDEAR